MHKTLLISMLILGSTSSIPIIAATGNPTDYLPPSTDSQEKKEPFDLGDWVNDRNESLDKFETKIAKDLEIISNTIGGWVKTVGGVLQPVNSIFQDVNSLVNLVYRLIQLPSSAGGWWDVLLSSVEGELDPCLNSPWVSLTQPTVYEPGWCLGAGGEKTENGGDDNLLLPHSADPVPFAGKKPWKPSEWNSDSDNTDSANATGKPPVSISTILKNSKGSMGIPIPSTARAKIIQMSRDDTTNTNDAFTSNPIVKAHMDGNLSDRAIIKISTETVLGEIGQKKMSDELDAAQDAVAYTLRQAGDAQQMDVTQDVMKMSIQVQGLTNVLLGSLVSANQQQRIDANMGNMALTNISRTLDEGRRTSNIDLAITGSRLISLTSQVGL